MTARADWLERLLPLVRKNIVLSYAIAAGCFAFALGLRWVLRDILPGGAPYITFFIAVLLATLFGGVGPGIIVLVASGVAAWFLWLPTATPVQVNAALAASALFSTIGAMTIYVVHLLNRTVERLLAAQDRAETQLYLTAMAEQQLAQLNGELRHRNKNTFSVLSALVVQTAKQEKDVSKFAANLRGRLSAMGAAQDLMISSQYRGADLRALVNDTLAPIVPPGDSRLALSGPSFFLPTDVATPLALVIHELATNSVKFGAWSNEAGRVSCHWLVRKSWEPGFPLVLSWTESGGPPAVTPARSGLGTVLIERSLPDASVVRTFDAGGMTCTINLNVTDVTTTSGVSQRSKQEPTASALGSELVNS